MCVVARCNGCGMILAIVMCSAWPFSFHVHSGHVVHTHMPLPPAVYVIWYWPNAVMLHSCDGKHGSGRNYR